MKVDEREYIEGMLKRDGVDIGDNSVHIINSADKHYEINVGEFKLSGETIAALSFMFILKVLSDEDGLTIYCTRREK